MFIFQYCYNFSKLVIVLLYNTYFHYDNIIFCEVMILLLTE